MYPFQFARIGKLTQVPADCLQRDAQTLCQMLDRDLAVTSGDVENFRVSDGLRHERVPVGLAPILQDLRED